jgi:hypothetical protein
MSKYHLDKKQMRLLKEVKKGIRSATDDTVNWVRGDVLEGQKYVGDSLFPQVKPSTKLSKMKAGKEKVLIMTGNARDSIKQKFAQGGMTGIINFGANYWIHLMKKWKIHELFRKERVKPVRKIMEKHIRRALR